MQYDWRGHGAAVVTQAPPHPPLQSIVETIGLGEKVRSFLPMVDSLQYRALTPTVCTGFLCP